MTKLLDYERLRKVQLFRLLYRSTMNDFFKTNKMVESWNLNTNEIVMEETKLLSKIQLKYQILNKTLAGLEHVCIENCNRQEMNKALQVLR